MIKLLSKAKIKKTKCKMCKCKYTYGSDDVDWYAGISKPHVICPVCKYENRV